MTTKVRRTGWKFAFKAAVMSLLLRNSDKLLKGKKFKKPFIIIQVNTVSPNFNSSQGIFVCKYYSNFTAIIIIVVHVASKFRDI